MKKTLVILSMACTLAAASASADTPLDTAVFSASGSSLQSSNSLLGLNKSGAFSYTLTFTDQFISFCSDFIGKPTSGMSNAIAAFKSSSNRLLGVAPGYSSEDGVITAGGLYMEYGADVGGNPYPSSNNSTYCGGSNFFSTISWDNVDSMAMTVTFGDATTQATANENGISYITVTYKDGTTAETHLRAASGDNLRWSGGFGTWSEINVNTDYVDSVYIFDSKLDESTAYAVNTAAINAVPEPATATLSLLALAGLAARRRRK